MTCWAVSLGDCAGGTSREHIISESQFEADGITVQGLPWCRDAPKTVGLASLVAKNLCRHHNTALSPTDLEAARFKRALAVAHSSFLPFPVNIDARLVERWLLKTTINLALQEPASGLDITPDLVQRAFGSLPTPRGQGFFLVVELGDVIEPPGSIRFGTLRRTSDDRIVLSFFVFHGWRALYAFDGAPAVESAVRPRRLNLDRSSIKFVWRPDFERGGGLMQ